MSKRSRFRKPFGSQRINGSQSLLKSARHHFYTLFQLIWDKWTSKKLLLVRFEILALFLKTMTTDDKISRRKRDYFAQQNQMQLSQEPKTFSRYFFAFRKFKSNFEYFEKRQESHSLSISQIIGYERGGYLKGLASEHLSEVNVLTCHNHC